MSYQTQRKSWVCVNTAHKLFTQHDCSFSADVCAKGMWQTNHSRATTRMSQCVFTAVNARLRTDTNRWRCLLWHRLGKILTHPCTRAYCVLQDKRKAHGKQWPECCYPYLFLYLHNVFSWLLTCHLLHNYIHVNNKKLFTVQSKFSP